MTLVLGLNTAYHDLAACLVEDGRLVAAVEEERFSRIKHGKRALIDNPDTLPVHAIGFCTRTAGVSLRDVDRIVIGFDPDGRLRNIGCEPWVDEGDWGSESGELRFRELLLRLPAALSELAGEDVRDRVRWVPHHAAHGASAFFVSPFEHAAVLAIDGIGEFASTWFGAGCGAHLRPLREICYPHSLGFLWEKIAKLLGFTEYDAQKLMGLASYGDPEPFRRAFSRLLCVDPAGGGFFIAPDLARFRVEDYSCLEELFGVSRLTRPENHTAAHRNVAATLQALTNEAVLACARWLRTETGAPNLCMAGGVALNCVSNLEILRSGLFDEVYVQPAAQDAGTALGAALHVHYGELGGERGFVMDHAYWGPAYGADEAEAALRGAGVRFEKPECIHAATARLIAEGKVVGWFQGRAEWGPRALGNRSLLADPRDPGMKDRLNSRIKMREEFRPFAPAVLAEEADAWFELPPCPSLSLGFMEFALPARPERRGRIPAVVHVDGTSRVQLVSARTNPGFHRLIGAFRELTGVPMVLNTSFNEHEPIVCSPEDAIRTFLRTGMDALAVEGFLVRREAPAEGS